MRRGFTIIELLVVIAIVCMLLALLTPGLERVERSVLSAQCMSNQHQLQIALLSYDRDMRLLPYAWQRPDDGPQGSWADSLIRGGYITETDKHKGLWLCPEQKGKLFGGYPSIAITYQLRFWNVVPGWLPLPARYQSLEPFAPMMSDSPPQPFWPVIQRVDVYRSERAVHLDRIAETFPCGSVVLNRP